MVQTKRHCEGPDECPNPPKRTRIAISAVGPAPAVDADGPKMASSSAGTERRKKKRPSFIESQTIVSIVVNKDENTKTFLVHKEILCHYSPFFNAAFNGEFLEGATLQLNLSDVLPEVFDIFVNWLYTQNVLADAETELQMALLVDLWILGDRLLVSRLQNQALAALDKIRVAIWKRPVSSYIRVYENTLTESPLRRYITQIAASGYQRSTALKKPELYPRDLLFDMFNYVRFEAPEGWVRFSEEELKQFFVEEEEDAEDSDAAS